MKKVLLNNFLENSRVLLTAYKSSDLKAMKLKELLFEEAEKHESIDQISTAKKTLVQIKREKVKAELLDEIYFSLNLLNRFEATSKFSIIVLPTDQAGIKIATKLNEIKVQLKSIVEGN